MATAKKATAKKAAAKAPAAKAAKTAKTTPAGKSGKPAGAAARPPVEPAPASNRSAKKATKKPAPAKGAAKRAAKDPAKGAAKKPATKAAAKKAPVKVPAGSEWTSAELTTVRTQLAAQLTELRTAYDASLRDLDDMQRADIDGAGDDQADAGAKTFEREQEQSIAANRRDLITQMQHAVERIDSGTYGFCESCGKPIPKARLKAFPAATLDVNCKQREERR